MLKLALDALLLSAAASTRDALAQPPAAGHDVAVDRAGWLPEPRPARDLQAAEPGLYLPRSLSARQENAVRRALRSIAVPAPAPWATADAPEQADPEAPMPDPGLGVDAPDSTSDAGGSDGPGGTPGGGRRASVDHGRHGRRRIAR